MGDAGVSGDGGEGNLGGSVVVCAGDGTLDVADLLVWWRLAEPDIDHDGSLTGDYVVKFQRFVVLVSPSGDALLKLLETVPLAVVCSLAGSADTPERVFRVLGEGGYSRMWYVWECLAGNPHTPGDVLRRVAASSRVRVRALVAKNPSTPTDVLEGLAEDSSEEVGFALVENPRISSHMLHLLAEHLSDNVAGEAKRTSRARAREGKR